MSGSGTKFLATTLLTLNLLPASLGAQPLNGSASGSRFAGTYSAQTEQEPQPTEKPRADDELEMAARRQRVNQAMLQLAKDDFQRLAALSEGGYSKDLNNRTKHLTRYLGKNLPDRPQGVYIDPMKFDAGIALGLTPQEATERLLAQRGVTVSADVLKSIADEMKVDDDSKFATKGSFTQDPSAHYDDFKLGPQACVIVPTSAINPEFQFKGLSYQDNIDYINRHESWHCMNTKFTYAGIDKSVLDSIDTDVLERSIGNDDQMKAISIANKRESLSDVGAIGDMIRHGKGLDLIDKVAAERASSPADYLHWTATSLEGLKTKINEMGIDRFRRMNDADARKLYEGVVDANTFTPVIAEVILNYREVSDDADRAAIRDWKPTFALLETMDKVGAAVHDSGDLKPLNEAIEKAGDDRTKKVLTAMRDQINEIGMDRFRVINDQDAEKIGLALKEAGAPSDLGANAVGYWRATPDERKQADADYERLKDAIPKALAMMKPYGEPPTDAEQQAARNAPPKQPVPLTPEEKKVFDQLAQWDASKLLQDRAFAKDKKITPATLIRAYGDMQDDLRGQLKKHPDDPLLRAKVTKLQQSFITTVQTLDYVDVNAQRNVNILEKEPQLVQYLKAHVPPGADKTPETKPEEHKPVPQALRRTPQPGV